MKKVIFYVSILFFVVATSFLIYYFFVTQKEVTTLPLENIILQESPILKEKIVDFSDSNSVFLFSAKIPKEFEVEYIPQLKAINIYSPIMSGENNIEKSQIYISFFKASKFLTLNTVEITKQDKITIKEHDAILYEITKKVGLPNFYGQPMWRNVKHTALDIRLTQDSPSYFYSFAQNPNLSQKVFDYLIDSLIFTNNSGK